MQRQIKPKEEEEKLFLQKERQPNSSTEITPSVEAGISSLRGGGQPFDPATRAYMEPRFGSNFSHVRIHADSRADDTARAVKARAFTVGHEMVFGAGQYAPGTDAGQRLLAHELTHVLQQGNSVASVIMTQAAPQQAGDSTPAPPPEKKDVQAAVEKVCGPDITQVIIDHLNAFVSQNEGDLSFLWFVGARELGRFARRNAPKIRTSADATAGCPIHRDCGGTYTIGGQCVSGYHIDHILIMAYIEASYGAAAARSAGQYNESFWLGFFTEGSEFETTSGDVSNADLTFNELAICMAQAMAHAEEAEDTTDLLTKKEVLECFKKADIKVTAGKPSITGSTAYADCAPCKIAAPAPTDLELPPVDV